MHFNDFLNVYETKASALKEDNTCSSFLLFINRFLYGQNMRRPFSGSSCSGLNGVSKKRVLPYISTWMYASYHSKKCPVAAPATAV